LASDADLIRAPELERLLRVMSLSFARSWACAACEDLEDDERLKRERLLLRQDSAEIRHRVPNALDELPCLDGVEYLEPRADELVDAKRIGEMLRRLPTVVSKSDSSEELSELPLSLLLDTSMQSPGSPSYCWTLPLKIM